VGRPLLGVEIQVQDADGTALPAGTVGELCARCGSIMTEYRGDPARTDQALRGGWYHTGDLGTLDEQGYVRITDRLDDMIVSGGENVYSSEVEAALAAHPEVTQVAVVGVPDLKWGQQVHAFVVVRGPDVVGEEELTAFLRQAIAGYKVPKSFTLQTAALPLSGAGKIQKHLLRASLTTESLT
jgi:acyl-CoA synthetase (AMP-forming)/AMP-acid ligase II